MALFKDRQHAGKLLAESLKEYKGKDVIVLGLPRGGVVPAAEIASALHAPLDIALAQKIGHPDEEEYAIAAVGESGELIGNPRELKPLDPKWLQKKKEEALEKMRLRRNMYGKEKLDLSHKIVILVDDGIATGLTMKAAIKEVKGLKPKMILVAIPMAPESTAEEIKKQVDRLICLHIDPDGRFLGAVGAYYDKFQQVPDIDVIDLLEKCGGNKS